MELRQLEYFVAVAEQRHFGQAAERLHIGQPAVSQQIRRLERDLGVELLDRSPRHVRLTAAGQRFLPRARAVLAAAEQARASVSTLARPDTVTLRLGTSAGLGQHLDDLLDALADSAPWLTVELISAGTQARLKQVASGELDAAFLRGARDTTELRVVPIWQDSLVAALPASHPLAAGVDVALADLAELPLRLIARRHNPALVDLVLTACQDAGFEPVPGPPPAPLTDTVAAIGAGTPTWTVVYAAQAAQLRSRRVAFRPFRTPGLSITTGLAVRRSSPPPTLELLLDACASTRATDGLAGRTVTIDGGDC
ncbi:MAG: LysR substrate-binding domain-containing protein [Frankia sp.]